MEEGKSLADANKPQAEGQKEQAPLEHKEQTRQETTKTQPVEKETEPIKAEAKPNQEPQLKPSKSSTRFSFSRHINKLKVLHPKGLKAKLDHVLTEYGRILHLARKPTREEYKELSIMVIVTIAVVGGIGFVLQMIIQTI